MLPIAIFRHAAHEGPGHFATLLDRLGLPWTLIAIDRGDPLPASPAGYSGLVFMGGPMSVNDDLAWISDTVNLIARAVAEGIPVLGHCLGGQLMAKALGGRVTANPVKEIGWSEVAAVDEATAQRWLGPHRRFPAFHWHGETFSLPEGATRLLSSVYCTNQAFVLGPHLALQCHVEMTAAMINEWCQAGAEEMALAAQSPGVASLEAIQAQTASALPAMQTVAEHLYHQWLTGLVQPNTRL